MWCADVLQIAQSMFVEFMVIFGPAVITFIQAQDRMFHNIGDTVQGAMEDVIDMSIPDIIIRQYGQTQIPVRHCRDIILKIIDTIQEIQAKCAPRNLNVHATSQELMHNTGLMQTLVTAFDSEFIVFLDFKFNLLPYLDLVNKIQRKKDKHISRMCSVAIRLDQEVFDLLPDGMKSEICHRLT